MAILQAAVFVGGRHHGERSQPPEHQPFPETLFCITWNDGERYARTDEHVTDADGRRRVVFRHDPDGALTARAEAEFSAAPS
jgi:hypothetical protein